MANSSSIVLSARALERTVTRMADENVERNDGTDGLVLVGIQRRGVQIAERIAARIESSEGVRVPLGALDITLYRDDLQTVGPRPVVGKTMLPIALDGRHVVIVDDMLFTGRTIRAALNALGEYGRAQVVELANQLRGRAVGRQVGRARLGLAVNSGGIIEGAAGFIAIHALTAGAQAGA